MQIKYNTFEYSDLSLKLIFPVCVRLSCAVLKALNSRLICDFVNM